MLLSAPHIKRIAIVVLLAFLGVRMSDAHLHVCLDGQEPPLTVHTSDGSVHHDEHHHEESEHNDRDVELNEAALFKVSSDADVFLPVIAFFLLPIILETKRVAANLERPPTLRPVSKLRPPLRGPPG